MEFCFTEDFQPARRETHCSKLLFHCKGCRQRFHSTEILLVSGFYWCLLSLHHIMRDLIILFIVLPARTLSCACNFLLLTFFSALFLFEGALSGCVPCLCSLLSYIVKEKHLFCNDSSDLVCPAMRALFL